MNTKDFKDGMRVIEFHCYIGSISEKLTKAGKPYISVLFKDEYGEIEANIWDTTVNTYGRQVNDVVCIEGNISSFKGKLQLKVVSSTPSIRRFSTFCKVSENNVDKMFEILVDLHIGRIKDKYVKFLMEELICTGPFANAYSAAPAALGVHHNWIGGLLEHSLNLCNMADVLYNDIYRAYFPTLNMDLVKFGCMFHDWGKIAEYDYSTPNFQYTKAGCMQHHMGIAIEQLVRSSMKYEIRNDITYDQDADKNRKILQQLQHIIYSHHGSPEWGSMVRPATAEALFVHQLDYMDGQMMHMREMIKDRIEGDIPGMSKKSWAHQTQYLFLDEEKGF